MMKDEFSLELYLVVGNVKNWINERLLLLVGDDVDNLCISVKN